MEGATAGLVGGIVGSVMGVMGGVIGTWASIANTNGPRERAFVIRASVLCWLGIMAFLAGLFLVPSPWNLLLWIPYGPLLVISIRKWNREQMRIRDEEAGRTKTHEDRKHFGPLDPDAGDGVP
jgi:hypothetical protein